MTSQSDSRSSTCPLCSGETYHFCTDTSRQYVRCLSCSLVSVARHYWLSEQEEKAVYELHQNDEDDPGYRNFLSRLSVPLSKKLGKTPAIGLDYGCGPSPALSRLLEQNGYSVMRYDPFFVEDSSVLQVDQYDFVTATEVVEHFFYPEREFSKLFSLLKPGGLLAMMTKLVVSQQAFSNWHYKRDPTHVIFFSRETFAFLAEHYSAKLEIIGSDVVFLQKS